MKNYIHTINFMPNISFIQNYQHITNMTFNSNIILKYKLKGYHLTKQEILEIFKFFYDGNLIPIAFSLLVVYFVFRKRINFIKYKFLSDIFVIAFFIFSIDIALFPHRYFNLIKNYLVVKQDILNTTNYSTDLKFVMDTYANNKLDNPVKFNIKDGVLEEFKYIKDVKM